MKLSQKLKNDRSRLVITSLIQTLELGRSRSFQKVTKEFRFSPESLSNDHG